MTAPLILTLTLDPHSFTFFDAQRRRYFPPDRNHIPAHLTLFHALPGDTLGTIAHDLRTVCADREPFPLHVAGLRSLGRGVSYRLESGDLTSLRRRLAERWGPWLTPQDRQAHSPHITVQNKVEPHAARALLAKLQAHFEPFTATGEGLELWHYRGGPWEPAGRFAFSGALGRVCQIEPVH
jgi:2'-5' RNA ligase